MCCPSIKTAPKVDNSSAKMGIIAFQFHGFVMVILIAMIIPMKQTVPRQGWFIILTFPLDNWISTGL